MNEEKNEEKIVRGVKIKKIEQMKKEMNEGRKFKKKK